MKKKLSIGILYEDGWIVAINKAPRVASVPASEIPLYATALGGVQRYFESTGLIPYILHRLDYATSGVLLFGKKRSERTILEQIFRDEKTSKKYIALVKGVPRPGCAIKKELPARTKGILVAAETRYTVIRVFPEKIASLVEATIATGRKHQIRKHFASIGNPLVLDDQYGDKKFNRKFRMVLRLGRLALHAAEISFFHPFLKKQITIKAPLPPDLAVVLKRVGIKI